MQDVFPGTRRTKARHRKLVKSYGFLYTSLYLNLLRTFYGVIFLAFLFTRPALGQSSESGQFWTNYKFSHPFGNQWATELDITGRFSDTPKNQSIFTTKSQFGVRGWVHYHFSPRWRFSASFAYFNNYYVPDISQENSNEFRYTLQGVYFFHKIGYTFSTRGRAEFRNIHDNENGIVNSFRYRQRVKYQKPLNSKSFRKGVFYILASDEIFFRVNATEDYNSFFDRNRMTLGGGYVINDNIQAELAYVNEFLPRSDQNEIIHALSISLTFNNLMAQLRKKLKKSE